MKFKYHSNKCVELIRRYHKLKVIICINKCSSTKTYVALQQKSNTAQKNTNKCYPGHFNILWGEGNFLHHGQSRNKIWGLLRCCFHSVCLHFSKSVSKKKFSVSPQFSWFHTSMLSTLRAKDTMPQAVLLHAVRLLSYHTNLEPWREEQNEITN